MNHAFGISEDDVEFVLRENWEKLDARGMSFSALAEQVFNGLDTDRVEKAALDSGTDMDEQTAGAHAEIAKILIEDGYLKPPVNEQAADPLVIARTALRECLGFVEAWQLHLADTGKDAAAKTVSEVLANARRAYLNSDVKAVAQDADLEKAAEQMQDHARPKP